MQHAATNISVSSRMMSSLAYGTLSCRENGQAMANFRCCTISKDDVTEPRSLTAADTKILFEINFMIGIKAPGE
jgi:hypothetical protein